MVYYRGRRRSRYVSNPRNNNNVYVRGLSGRTTNRDLEKHFSTEGKVLHVHLLLHPCSTKSPRRRLIGFVTMSTLREAKRCIRYLDRSVLRGRVIMVDKAKRHRALTTFLRRLRHSPSSYSSSSSSTYSSRRFTSVSSDSRSSSPYRRSPVSKHGHYHSSGGYSPHDRHYRRSHYRSVSRSISPSSKTSNSRNPPRYSYRRRDSPSVSSSMSSPPRTRTRTRTKTNYGKSGSRPYSYRHGYSDDSYSSTAPSSSTDDNYSSTTTSSSTTASP